MIGTRTGAAVDQVGPILSPAHQTVPEASCLVDALITIPEIWPTLYSVIPTRKTQNLPVAFRDDGNWRLKTVSVIALVTAVTE